MSKLEINPDLPLKEFKKQIPKHKYNDILKLRVLESNFDNTMEQYQRTFQNIYHIQNNRLNMNGEKDIC